MNPPMQLVGGAAGSRLHNRRLLLRCRAFLNPGVIQQLLCRRPLLRAPPKKRLNDVLGPVRELHMCRPYKTAGQIGSWLHAACCQVTGRQAFTLSRCQRAILLEPSPRLIRCLGQAAKVTCHLASHTSTKVLLCACFASSRDALEGRSISYLPFKMLRSTPGMLSEAKGVYPQMSQ